MRQRNVKNKKEIIEKSKYVVSNPNDYINNWYNVFDNDNPIYIEIGMGKGNFIIGNAEKYPNINFVGIEKFDSILALALKKMEELELPNVRVIRMDAFDIDKVFNHEINKIFLNFSDPWPKKRQNKRRLTYPTCLKEYFRVLKPGGKVIFKTDNDVLFEDSLGYFDESDFSVVSVTHDYILEDGDQMTEYEKKFRELGTKIKRLVAVKDR